jgi:hypothetical protein
MTHKDLRYAVCAREVHERFNRVIPVEGRGLCSHMPRFEKPLLKDGFIFLGKPVIADIHGEKFSMESVGIAPSALDHGLGIRSSRQANEDAFLGAPKLLDTVSKKVILKLPVNHLGGKK